MSRLVVICLLVICVVLIGAAPATQPASQIRTWFDQLADPQALTREEAVDHLLALTPADLPALRKVVEESRPIRPSQRTVLRDIVDHVYRTGIRYEPAPGQPGFLGVVPRDAEPDPATGESPGVLIDGREPGFAPYRLLRNGDIVTAIAGVATDSREHFTTFIRSINPGQIITLDVLRDGRKIRVDVPVTVTPDAALSNVFETWRESMEFQADQYWNKNFRPLIGDDELSQSENIHPAHL